MQPVPDRSNVAAMTQAPPLMVFTDLDGTLLDHDSYRWDAATDALDALRAIGAAVVLASSKTAAEIIPLREELGFSHWPAIVENGAGLLAASETHVGPAADYERLRTLLNKVPMGVRTGFRGFGDMTVAEVAQITGLATDAATLAKQRAFSEPGLWAGSDEGRRHFIATLAEMGVSAREGGRFLTLSFGQTKADQMATIIDEFRPGQTMALGDAPNDVEMLQTAGLGVIVANPHRPPLPPLPGEETGRIIRTDQPGPIGWNSAVLSVVERLGKDRKDNIHG